MSNQTNDYKQIIGKNIKLALSQKGKTQSWLADELDMYKSQLNGYTKGQSMPNPELFQKIAEMLDLTVQQLLCRSYLVEEEGSLDADDIKALNSNYSEDVSEEFSLTNELKAECQSAINYAKTLQQSTNNKKIKSLANLIKNKITFVSENMNGLLK